MQKNRFLINLVVTGTVFFFLTGFGAKNKLGERDMEFKLTYDGQVRDYIVHVPLLKQSLKETQKKRPLVLVLHGGGGTAKGMPKLTRNRFDELSDQHGFFVVYPQGLGKSWNEGAKDSKGYAREHQIDDVGFFKALLTELEKKFPIDERRVFSTGISNGGLMSYRLACEMPDKIRAIAPVAASVPEDILGICREPKATVSGLLVMNGTEDPIVPYQGGNIEVFGRKRGRVISTDETVDLWLSKNGCRNTPKVEALQDGDPKDGTRVQIFTYDQCTSGVPVIHYQIQGGGHTWAGGWQYLRERRIGKTSRDIDAADEIWKFFSSFN